MREFKPGDVVRAVKDTTTFKKGDILTVTKVMVGDLLFFKEIKTGWYAKRFELVTNAVDINLRGSVISRNDGAVSVKLNDGTVVVLPETLVPPTHATRYIVLGTSGHSQLHDKKPDNSGINPVIELVYKNGKLFKTNVVFGGGDLIDWSKGT